MFRQVKNLEALEKSILSREKVMSTGLGRSVAISHGEAPELQQVIIALGISKKGIEYESVDGSPVHLLFVVVNSKLKRAEYLEVLASLTRLMRMTEVRTDIRCCTCSQDVKDTLEQAFRELLVQHP